MSEPNATSNDLAAGTLIDGRYAIVSKLGEGGMGAVYEADQLALQRRVALKVIHPAFAGDGEIRARFAREATASAQLDGHPHVASALDFGTLPDGSLYLVMQLVRGPSLRDLLDHGRLPWERAVRVATQVADALSAAHAKGIIHRDLKPDNVSLVRREDDREIAKVLDFGIARVTSPDASGAASATKLTRVGTIMGTPGYMAPEQAVGDVVDERADLYALGVMLYEMLVGVLPFDGPDFTTIVARQFAEPPPPPSEAANDPSVPKELDALTLALLARSAGERPSSAAEVLRALEALARNSNVDGRPITGSIPLSDAASATGAQPTLPAHAAVTPVPTSPGSRLAALEGALAARLPPRLAPHALPIAGGAVGLVLFVAIVVIGTRGPSEPPAPGTAAAVEAAIATDEPHEQTLAPELAAAVETLANSEDRAARTAAAAQVGAATSDPAMPPYAVQLAAIESARSCRAKKAPIVELRSLGDARALPYLRRLDQSPRRGCGFMNTRDCLACLREELSETLTALEGR